jgi:hypothetical protein
VESALTSLTLDKWKKGSVREEARENVSAILRDLKDNVPPMMADADAAPDSLSKSIPLMKHLDAVYDVFLRVEEGARVSAPGDQVDKLIDVLKKFEAARSEFYDSLQQRAAGQEKQLADMKTQLKEQQAAIEQASSKPAPAPAPVPCTPPKPAVKKKRTTPKSTTPPTNNQNAPANTSQQPPAQQKPQ